jgi:hypothetical protein
MVYGSELARVNLIFEPKDTDWPGEEAVCGFWLQHQHVTGNVFTWSHQLQFLADRVATKLGDHWADLGTYLGSGYKITQVRAAQIGTDGRETDAKTSAIDGDTLAGSGTHIMPPEVAVVVSLFGYTPGTFTAHAGRKRSRMYWPYVTASFADGAGKNGSANLMSLGFKDFFNDIQGMHADDETALPSALDVDSWHLVVASKVGAEVTQVQHISVDDHFDSQRRRQHQSPAVRHLQDITV